MTTIVFDLNRTLYDPETNLLYLGVREMLEILHKKGIIMHVLSRKEPGRGDILGKFDISQYFKSVTLVAEKTQVAFQEIFEIQQIDPAEAYVIGDYLHEDIRHGNQCGAKTILVKQGKFIDLEPECADDSPWKVVRDIKEVLLLI